MNNAQRIATLWGGWSNPRQPLGGKFPALWLLADDIAGADGDAVATWTSKEGNAITFTAAATKQPLLKKAANGINGHNVLRFDGNNDIMVYAGSFDHTQGTIFAVYKLNLNVKQYHVLLGSGDEASATRYFAVQAYINIANIDVVQTNNDTADSVRGGTTVTTGETYIAVFKSNGTAYAIRLNGADETLAVVGGANSGDWFGDTANTDNLTIGGIKINSETSFLRGDLAELIVYSTGLGSADIARVEQYLAQRYAVSL